MWNVTIPETWWSSLAVNASYVFSFLIKYIFQFIFFFQIVTYIRKNKIKFEIWKKKQYLSNLADSFKNNWLAVYSSENSG